MPSALETLVKILKLEREQGYKNTAVIGGFSAYSQKWSDEAHKQARKPEHHKLVEELENLLQNYEKIEQKGDRHQTISYMMDRIMGRVPPPPQYQVTESTTPSPPAPVESPPQAEPETPHEAAPPRQAEQPPRSERPQDRPRPERDKPRDKERDAKKSKSRPQGKQEARRDNRGRGPAADAGDDGDDGPSGYDEYEVSQDDFIGSPRKGGKPSRAPQLDIPPQPRLARAPRKPRSQISPEEAADILRGLNAPVTTVNGVGPRMAKSLDKLNIQTINDLLFFLPRRYDDYTRLSYISKLKPNITVTLIGTVVRTEIRIGRNSRKDFLLELDDGSGVLNVVFFGQHFLIRQIRRGQQLVISGTTSIYGSRLQMVNPEWEELDAENLHTVGIVPVYPLTDGLGARAMRRLMKKTVEYWAERLPDYMPEATLERAELGDLGWAVKNLHFPEGMDHLHHAQQRFIFDQLLMLQLAILANRRDWQSVPGPALHVADDFLDSFIDAVFPYPLTAAQRRAIEDIRRDISTTTPMNRLLQGDVGSGKTAVAVTALAMALVNGKQSAIMAPTSILAEQHYRNISAAVERFPTDRRPVVALLTGALSTSERESIYRGMADGSIDIVVGTHALIQSGVTFNDLALVVIDEQHRFGVEQRAALRGKGGNPHLLVMTATPIPRTLALTIYADLDLSVMDEMPPGRVPVQTRLVEPIARERIYSFVESQLKQGRQAFIVYPLVESSDRIDAQAAVDAYHRLSKVFFRHRVGLLHGRMKPAEKDDIMAAFSRGEFDVLVTTSVAEVGVDIPNASVIVIEGANRFGLAQLHQFRGRVGRGSHASYCLLIPDNISSEGEDRLKALESTTDGFKLAEIDWQMRGAGDLVGTRQSGRAMLQLAEGITPQLVELAQREARTLYEEDPYLQQPQHSLLAQRVAMLFNRSGDVS